VLVQSSTQAWRDVAIQVRELPAGGGGGGGGGGGEHAGDLRGVRGVERDDAFSTTTKHGHNQLSVLRDALTGQPWIPEPPAPT